MISIYGQCQNVFGSRCKGNVNWVESVCITMIVIDGLNVLIIRGDFVLKALGVVEDM